MKLPSITPILTIILIPMLAGCATVQPSVAPEVAARIKRVAVISMTADKFTRQYVGVTMFGNEREQKSITSWAIDQAYEDQLAAAAENVFGATVIRARYSQADFSHVNDLNGPWDAPAFWGPNWKAIESPTKLFCSANTLDALLVVARRKSNDFFGGTLQIIAGAGIYAKHGTSLLHLLSVVALLDCRTGKTISVRWLTQRLILPNELSRTPIPQWSEEQQNQIRAELTALPKHAWEGTLRKMLSPN